MKKSIEAWAVWNMELNIPCVFVSDTEILGGAIFPVTNYNARGQAREYLRKFTPKFRKQMKIKLIKIIMTRK